MLAPWARDAALSRLVDELGEDWLRTEVVGRRGLEIVLPGDESVAAGLLARGAASVTLYSPSKSHVRDLRLFLAVVEPRGVQVDLANPGYLPCDSDSFDFVIALHALERVIDPLRVLDEAFRVLRPGGALLVGVEFCGASRSRLQRWLRLPVRVVGKVLTLGRDVHPQQRPLGRWLRPTHTAGNQLVRWARNVGAELLGASVAARPFMQAEPGSCWREGQGLVLLRKPAAFAVAAGRLAAAA